MLIVFLVICIVLLIVLHKLKDAQKIGWETYDCAAAITWAALGIVVVVALICAYIISEEGARQEKLSMYEQENARIESDIATMIDQYMTYEGNIVDRASVKNNESALALVNLYPDLKTSELVNQQIQIHTENNAKIKELKEDLIDLQVAKWWLYFGGGNK